MEVRTKNIIGGVGLILLAGAAVVYATHSPAKPAQSRQVNTKHHPALLVDISNYNADEIIAFVRGLGNLADISDEDRIALFKKLKARFDKLPGAEKMILMSTAMEAYQSNKLDPVVVNGRELMKAYQHEMLVDYFHADADGRKKMLDERIQEHKNMESLRKLSNMGGLFGSGDNSNEQRMSMMRQQIGDAIQDSLKNGTAEDRAMMTQFMIEMRKRGEDQGVKWPM